MPSPLFFAASRHRRCSLYLSTVEFRVTAEEIVKEKKHDSCFKMALLVSC